MDQKKSHKKEKVLFVDDEKAILKNLEIELSDDFEIFTALSINDALGILEKNADIKVVVSDQKMGVEGDLEGSDLLKTVSEKYPEIMRILLTGYPEYGVSLKAIKDGKVHDFIVKSGDYKEIVRKAIYMALEQYSLLREMRRLRSLSRQLESYDVIQLVPDMENGGICDARIVEYKSEMREITKKYFVDVVSEIRGIFSPRKTPPDPRADKFKFSFAGNGSIFNWLDMYEYLGKFLPVETIKDRVCGKEMSERKFRDMLFEEVTQPERINEALHYLMFKMPRENLSQIVLYNDKGWYTIQDQLDAMYMKYSEREKGEKVIIQKCSVLKDARIIKVKQEGNELIGYDEDGKKIGTAGEFVDSVAKIMCE